jgi:hypothetical protein
VQARGDEVQLGEDIVLEVETVRDDVDLARTQDRDLGVSLPCLDDVLPLGAKALLVKSSCHP